MDEVRVWNIARTAAQINQCMYRGLVGNEPGLMAYWPFDEGNGNTVGDFALHGYTGKLNAPTWSVETAPIVPSTAAFPVAFTGSVTNITTNSATIFGRFNGSGLPTTAYFEYGLTANYGQKTTPVMAGGPPNPIAITNVLLDLQPGQHYHCRLTASNAAGTSHGADVVFLTYAPTPALLWTYDLCAPATSPTLGTNGTIYIGTSGGMYAITNSGSVASNKWIFSAPVSTAAAIGSDGTIYFGDANPSGGLHALNLDGSEKWVFQPQPQNWVPFQSSPLIGYDNTLYFVARGALYAVSPTGIKKWQYLFDEELSGAVLSPVMGSDGTIFVTSYNRILYAIRSDGVLKWSRQLPGPMGESPAIALDGTILVTSSLFYAFTADGTNLWRGTVYGGTHGSPIIATDGTIYVGDGDDFGLSAFSPAGTGKWHVLPASSRSRPPPSTPALDSAGNIYYCTSNTLWSLNPEGQVLWNVPGEQTGTSPSTASPVIGPDGTIYAYLHYKLYAVAGTNALSDSVWPMYRANARHTGKTERPVFQKPQKGGNNGFEFQLYGDLGRTNTIQASPDLTTWTPLTNILITNLPMDFIDWDATNFPSRFYRTFQQ